MTWKDHNINFYQVNIFTFNKLVLTFPYLGKHYILTTNRNNEREKLNFS